MELRQLEYFAAVARHRHFRRAAEESYVTQSALSQQVRRLEEELGLLLLRRTPHGVELTPAGRDLAERADAILAEVAEARAAMDGHAGVERGVARIAASPADAPRRIPGSRSPCATARPPRSWSCCAAARSTSPSRACATSTSATGRAWP
jgi:DNA-binding transcriptional LysR family regulator